MRLKRVENGRTLGKRVLFGVMGVMMGQRAPDVARTLMYRPELFGKAFGSLLQRVMRGDSSWSVGERELFAGFTSKLSQCPF